MRKKMAFFVRPVVFFVSFTLFVAVLLLTRSTGVDAQIDSAKGDSQIVMAPQTGTISGKVFQDFNSDGLFDNSGGTAALPAAVDIGVAGVVVTAYTSLNASAGTATTASDGTYSISATGTGPYRVEFTSIPSGYSPSFRSRTSGNGTASPGASSSNSGTTVQFVPNGNTANLNLGLVKAKDYCQDNPNICSQLYGVGTASQPEALFTVPFRAGSTRTGTENGAFPTAFSDFMTGPQNSLATTDDIGTTFGLAYNRNTKVVYASAFMKKHSMFGPAGTGAIYQVTSGGSVSVYANLNTIFGANTAGANPHNTGNYDSDNGNTTWNAVGKVGLGGMAISDDQANLFVMNLANTTIYRVPTSGTLNTSTIRTYVFPTTISDCAATTDVRPFAVTYYEGLVYVGAICSGDSTNSPANLRAYVYSFDPAATTTVFTQRMNFPLNYSRMLVDPGVDAKWNDWTTSYANIATGSNFIYPQPWLTDIDFDRGNMILSLRDRMGDQTSVNSQSNPNNTNTGKGITAGDVLRACGNPTNGWTLESNGVCGGITSAGTGTGEGPNNGEYYYQEDYHTNSVPHYEVGMGAAHQVPGFNVSVMGIFDPIYMDGTNVYDSQGFRWFVNSTGAQNRGYLSNSGDFGKANGQGNVIVMCDAAPIEIGNRIWIDTDKDGVQDPGEVGLAGVTVHLYNSSGTLVGTAVTDANGEYIFTYGASADSDTTDSTGYVNGGILPNSTYYISLDRNADYLSGGALFGYRTTIKDQTSQLGDDDSSDNDAEFVLNPTGSPTGSWPSITVTTGGAGASNHTYDFGVYRNPSAAGVDVSGRVMTAQGNGLVNAQIVMAEADGTVRRAITGPFGYYQFEDVTAGQTVILTVVSKRFTFSNPTRFVNVRDNITDYDWTADPDSGASRTAIFR